MILYLIIPIVIVSILLQSAESSTPGNCFPYDALSKNSSYICQGDFISLHFVWSDNSKKYLAIRSQPEGDMQFQRTSNTGDSGDPSTAFQIFPMPPWTQGTPPGWTDSPPQYVRDAIGKGNIYPFTLKDFKGRWLKVSPPNYLEKKWQVLYVDNRQSMEDNTNDVLYYIPNYVLTTRSSASGGEPSGWIVRGSDGVVLWKFGKYDDEVIFDGNGPLPQNYAGCETLSLWTIAQTQSPPTYTGYTEKVTNVKYNIDTALKNMVVNNEVAPDVGNATIANASPTEQNLIITMSTTKSNTWTFNKDARYSFTTTAQTWIGMPFLGTGMQISVSSEIAQTTGTGNSRSLSTHYSVSAMIPVPPLSIMSGQLWLTKVTMNNIPLTYSVIRSWPNGDEITFDVVDMVHVVQYYDAVVCISKALNISAGVSPGCTPPPFRMWNSNGTQIVLPFAVQG